MPQTVRVSLESLRKFRYPGTPDQNSTRSYESQRSLRFNTSNELLEPDDGLLSRLVFDPRFETFGGFVVLFNFIIMTMETHATATGDDNVLNIVGHTNRILLVYYTGELIIRVYVIWKDFFKSRWNTLDLCIVVTGWVSGLFEISKSASFIPELALLKIIRMLRLLRIIRLFVAFRALYDLIAGIGRCIKTLFWAPGLIFLVLNVWAILSVELLDEKVKELVPSGVYRTCSWCDNAFSNIWTANLTWFQIVSTADWTAIGRPLAEEYWWPYVFFALNVFIVLWGLLNLIVAAIVDAHIVGREQDITVSSQRAEEAYNQAWSHFELLCSNIDADRNGEISVSEFKYFVENNAELKQYLTLMGIQADDVYSLVTLMDVNDSGALECTEFIEQITKMRTLVEKTSLYLLLRRSENIEKKLAQQSRNIHELQADLSEVKRSCVRGQTSRDMNASDSMKSVRSAGSDYSRASELSSADVRSTATETMAKTRSQTLRMTTQSKMLPSGWYYFGASLPPEASMWCKAVEPPGELIRSFRVYDDPNEAPITADGQRWEPIRRAPKLRTPRQKQNVKGVEVCFGKPACGHVKFEGDIASESSGLIMHSKFHGGATRVKILESSWTPPGSPRQNSNETPKSECPPSLENAQHLSKSAHHWHVKAERHSGYQCS